MLSKTAFLFAISVYAALTYAAGILLLQSPDEQALWVFVVGGTASIVFLGTFVFVYKIWGALQDGYTKMTPLLAALPTLIPGINLVWFFVSIFWFARTCNAYIARHDVPTKKLPTWIFLLLPIASVAGIGTMAWLVAVPIAIGLSIIVIWTSIEAVNAIIHHQQAEAAIQQQ